MAGAGWGPCPPRLGIEFWGGFNALVFVGGSSTTSMLRMSIPVPRVALTSFTCAATTANFEKEVAHEDGGRNQGVQKACSPHGWSHERMNGIYRRRPEERTNRVGIAPNFAAPDRIAAAEYGVLGGGRFGSGSWSRLGRKLADCIWACHIQVEVSTIISVTRDGM